MKMFKFQKPEKVARFELALRPFHSPALQNVPVRLSEEISTERLISKQILGTLRMFAKMNSRQSKTARATNVFPNVHFDDSHAEDDLVDLLHPLVRQFGRDSAQLGEVLGEEILERHQQHH